VLGACANVLFFLSFAKVALLIPVHAGGKDFDAPTRRIPAMGIGD
jgi:hypothetical protein